VYTIGERGKEGGRERRRDSKAHTLWQLKGEGGRIGWCLLTFFLVAIRRGTAAQAAT